MAIYANIGTSQYNYSVRTLWEKLLPRLDLSRNSVNFLDSCQEVIEIITERIWFRHSELLRQDITYTINDNDFELVVPSEFLAIASEPFILDSSNNTVLLTNIHESRRYDYLNEKDKPQYYFFNSSTITLFPTSDDTYTVVVPCYVKPTPLNSMQDSLPFNGLFNQLIGDNAVNITNVGLRIMSDSTFIASIHEKVDKMLNQRNKKTIYFRQTGTGSQRIYSGSTFY